MRYFYLQEQQLSSWCFSDQRMIENVWSWFRLRIYTPLPAPTSSSSGACRFLAPAPPRVTRSAAPSKWVSQNAKVQAWSLTIHHSPPQSLLPRLRQSKTMSDPFLLYFPQSIGQNIKVDNSWKHSEAVTFNRFDKKNIDKPKSKFKPKVK